MASDRLPNSRSLNSVYLMCSHQADVGADAMRDSQAVLVATMLF
jgi:hypothetical protein